MVHYQSPQSESWKGRYSADKVYWYQHVQCAEIDLVPTANKAIGLLSYACDEGVKRNQGRVGAADGPMAIKAMLGPCAWHLDGEVYDFGSIHCPDGDLESVQQALAEMVQKLLRKKYIPLIIGGGHDIVWGHYQGILKYLNAIQSDKILGIINVDAHFDLRLPGTSGHSGSSFAQIAQHGKAHFIPFKYCCIGIQRVANTQELYNRAREYGVRYMESSQMNTHSVHSMIENFCREVDYVYLTIDMDVFSSAYVAGVSAPSPLGCEPAQVLNIIDMICALKKLISIDIAELNPMYDVEGSSARLAARLIEHIAFGLSKT